VASRLDAARDAALSAGRDVALIAAADESHSYSKTKKVTSQQDHVEQQASTLDAGGDVTVSAGENLTLKASKIGAGNEAYLVAGDKLELQAANDSDYSSTTKRTKAASGKRKPATTKSPTSPPSAAKSRPAATSPCSAAATRPTRAPRSTAATTWPSSAAAR
jgi:hypothetical protein